MGTLFIGIMVVWLFLWLLAFWWAGRQGHFENLEFTKYKVFNDAGPDEPHPSPFFHPEREPSPSWRKWLLGSMLAWLLINLSLLLWLFKGGIQ